VTTTSPFDDDRTIQFYGGPWDGMPYTPRRGEQYPARLDMPWSGQLHHYRLVQRGGVVQLSYMGKALPDGAPIA
jgi:hypothetical protein